MRKFLRIELDHRIIQTAPHKPVFISRQIREDIVERKPFGAARGLQIVIPIDIELHPRRQVLDEFPPRARRNANNSGGGMMEIRMYAETRRHASLARIARRNLHLQPSTPQPVNDIERKQRRELRKYDVGVIRRIEARLHPRARFIRSAVLDYAPRLVAHKTVTRRIYIVFPALKNEPAFAYAVGKGKKQRNAAARRFCAEFGEGDFFEHRIGRSESETVVAERGRKQGCRAAAFAQGQHFDARAHFGFDGILRHTNQRGEQERE